ncbi:MAG: Gfo/Idh/MocA family oxidoreductase, partial [Armatimonadota bacterium]|nr:Gfo/Idh/MocA family oxidoreductase [Armatimonadota bacterium]
MPLRVGVIGTGAIGQRRHIPECVANPNTELVALCDPNEERVKEVAARFGGQPFTDYKEMLRQAPLDAVV